MTRNGLLMWEQMIIFFPSMQSIVLTFEIERALYMKDYTNNLYGCLVYYLSKNVVEMPPRSLWPMVVASGIY